jgi:hypothetical protein
MKRFFAKLHNRRDSAKNPLINNGYQWIVLLIGLIFTGCSFTAPKPTPAPIYVTATLVAQFDTPTQEGTLVLGKLR